MIIEYKPNDGRKCLAITLDGFQTYEDITDLQNALIWALKCMALNGDNCGACNEEWQIANLLEQTLLTPSQAHAVKL